MFAESSLVMIGTPFALKTWNVPGVVFHCADVLHLRCGQSVVDAGEHRFGRHHDCSGGTASDPVMDIAHEAPSLAVASNHAAFNLANALGLWFGSMAITAGRGWAGQVLVASVRQQHLIDKIGWACCYSRFSLHLSPVPNSACIYLLNRSLNVRTTLC